MKPLHKIAMVFTTFVLAAATGHVMQNQAQFGLGQQAAAPEAAPMELSNIEPVANTEPTAEQLAQLEIRAPSLPETPQMRTPTDAGLAPMPQDTGLDTPGFAAQPAAPKCAAPQLTAQPAASGTALLSLTAPCLPGQEAEIRHEGLRLPILLSAEGRWSGVVPAFAEQARFSVALPEGPSPEAVLTVSGLADLHRIAVATGGMKLALLHGYEYGAAPGTAGDVSAANRRDGATGLGGWLAVFDTPKAATPVQIYTAPAAMSDIWLALEVPVTSETCGKDLTGTVARLHSGTTEQAMLTLAMPDCGDGDGAVMMQLPDFPLALATAN